MTVKTDFSEFAEDFKKTKDDYCQPSSFCELRAGCQPVLPASDPLSAESQRICKTWQPDEVASTNLEVDTLEHRLGFISKRGFGKSHYRSTCHLTKDPDRRHLLTHSLRKMRNQVVDQLDVAIYPGFPTNV